ncbi:hypothetical protein C1H46_032552 [Malus baccata]|uniref:WW domain-containing protein n=1 Tax=Malus baccata TaxID=106549 RepID=A0A540L603_MALBA|nr:hypothetical protein C1H46_032552 [Malus baccata]
MSDPINWYQSQRSTVDLWFASVDPTLSAPWRSVMDESGGLVFYWNPETNVSQYEHPNLAQDGGINRKKGVDRRNGARLIAKDSIKQD